MPGPVFICAWVMWPSFTRAVWSCFTAAPVLPRSSPAGGAVTPEGLVGVGAGFAGVRSLSISARVFGPNTPSAVSLLAVWYFLSEASVWGPKVPGPVFICACVMKPSFTRADWSCFTAGPEAPLDNVPVGSVGVDEAATVARAAVLRDVEEMVLTGGSGGEALKISDGDGIIARASRKLRPHRISRELFQQPLQLVRFDGLDHVQVEA